MASGPMVGGDEGAKEKPRNTERKVYTRKVFRGSKKNPNALNAAAPATTPFAKTDDTASAAKNGDTTTAINDTATATTSASTITTTAETDNTVTAKNEDTVTAETNNTVTAKNEDTVTTINDTATGKKENTATAINHTPTPTTSATTTGRDDDTAPAATTTAAATSTPTATSSATTVTLTAVSAATTATNNIDGNKTDSTVIEPKSNSNDISAEPSAPPAAVPEDVNLAQLQENSRLNDGHNSQQQEDSRLDVEDSATPLVSSRLEDGDSAQLQVVSGLEDENLAQPPVSSRLEVGDTAQPQVVSGLEDENLAQPQVSSRLEDGDTAQPQVVSGLEDENLAQPQVSSRLEDGDTTQPQVVSRLEDENLAQPQVSSILEDGDTTHLQVVSGLEDENLAQPQVSSRLEAGNLVLPQVDSRLEGTNSAQPPVVQAADDSCSHQQEEPSSLNVQRDDDRPLSLEFQQDAAPSIQNLPSGNEAMEPELEERIKISLSSKSKHEMREIRWKLESELDVVRNLVKRIELKQGQVGGYGRLNVLAGDRIANGSGAKRALSEVGSAGVPRESTRPLHQLSLSMLENSHGVSEIVEKEKRTPKANQFYRNSEFLLAKDKFPPAESNKKSKLHWKKQGGGEMGHGLGMGSKFYKSCSSLLEKLMKHKHGWVFNEPVDVERLGLHDYFTIITHPMDLGTVKTRLSKNWYKSPKEFAEDVKLTFHNAMTYNPKGQDVHVMAELLLKIFEDRWAIIESDYNREMRYGIDYGAAPPAPSPLSRKVPTFPPPPLDMRRILNRSESLTHTPRFMSITPSSRTPALKKPKAREPNKRDMTFEEKQKLSTNLQSLPTEKLDAIVQIIKKNTTALSQNDDEIEVDIDSVDAETLWELDRFVTNYKKSLSKNKRKLELAQARAEAQRNALQKNQHQAPAMQIEVPKETQANEGNILPSLTVQAGNQANNGSRSSSSSSSSSDSGSSSSDSDSDSSSASGSDAGSQGT